MMDQELQDVVTGAGKTVLEILGVHIVSFCTAESIMSKDPDCQTEEVYFSSFHIKSLLYLKY